MSEKPQLSYPGRAPIVTMRDGRPVGSDGVPPVQASRGQAWWARPEFVRVIGVGVFGLLSWFTRKKKKDKS